MASQLVNANVLVEIEEAFVEEVVSQSKQEAFELYSDIQSVGGNKVTIEPSSDGAGWCSDDFEDINGADDWKIVDATSGEYGPKLTLKRDAE